MCRFCGAPLRHTFVDLGMSPLCESYVPADQLDAMEPFYPLHVRVCERCFLVQLEEFVTARGDLHRVRLLLVVLATPGSSTRATTSTTAVDRFGLDADSLVVELASNDGYLLQHFVEPRHPGARHRAGRQRRRGRRARRASRPSSSSSARELADAARRRGPRAPTCSSRNNVLAQVPDLNDFVAGMERLLAPDGRRRRSSSRTCCG